MAHRKSLFYILFFFFCFLFCKCRGFNFTLDSLRDSLTRQEDSIVFSLIERAKYPFNPPTYSPSYLKPQYSHQNHSILEIFTRETEALQGKAGRYQNPEEIPFFPNSLPLSLVPPYNYSQILYPATASTNISKTIWSTYFNDVLPLFTTEGDDGNYGLTAASDLMCLQLLARRIHFGRFVAEVKFRDAPQDYINAIRAKDKDALNKLVTNKSVEEAVQKRVKKKAVIFGQNVTVGPQVNANNTGDGQPEYKVDPNVVFRLYKEWVIPLTKVIEVKYLLHRLD